MEKITEGGEEVLSKDEIENEGAQNVLSIEILAVLKSMKESMSSNNVLLQNVGDKSINHCRLREVDCRPK